MSIDICWEEFDHLGNLTSNGKHDFWHEIDHGFKKFDLDQITLCPCLSLKATKKEKDEARKLLTPPPK